jgi:hypothetical protein
MKNQSQRHFLHLKSHMDSPGIEHGPPRCEADRMSTTFSALSLFLFFPPAPTPVTSWIFDFIRYVPQLSANKQLVYNQPLKMELTQGSETSANYNYKMTPGKYPKEHIQLVFPFILLARHPKSGVKHPDMYYTRLFLKRNITYLVSNYDMEMDCYSPSNHYMHSSILTWQSLYLCLHKNKRITCNNITKNCQS